MGGESGILTHEPHRLSVFKTDAFGRSAISPPLLYPTPYLTSIVTWRKYIGTPLSSFSGVSLPQSKGKSSLRATQLRKEVQGSSPVRGSGVSPNFPFFLPPLP